MGELEGLKWIADVSLTLAFAAAAIYVLVRFIKQTLKDHREQLDKKDAEYDKRTDELRKEHTAEREALMVRLSEYDIYQRELTKETYNLINGFKEQLASMQMLRESEKHQITELISEKRNLQLKIQVLADKIDLWMSKTL